MPTNSDLIILLRGDCRRPNDSHRLEKLLENHGGVQPGDEDQVVLCPERPLLPEPAERPQLHGDRAEEQPRGCEPDARGFEGGGLEGGGESARGLDGKILHMTGAYPRLK